MPPALPRASLPPHVVQPGALCGPTSASAALLTHPGILLAGPRALLLQVAHPSVAAGVSDHSGYREDPFGRLLSTLATVATVAFAEPGRRQAALAQLSARHRGVAGRTPAGTAYSAAQPGLVAWVQATLVDSALAVDRSFLGMLDEPSRAAYYQEQRLVGCAFGVPEGGMPAELAGFAEWMAERNGELDVGAQARAIAGDVLAPPLASVWGRPGRAMELLSWPILAGATAQLLPAPLGRAYGLAPPGPALSASLAGLAGALRASSRRRRPPGYHPDAPTRLAARLTRSG